MYVGPDVLLPLASALAAILGVILMFWRKAVGFVRSAVQLLASKFSGR